MGFGISSTPSCPVSITGILTSYTHGPYQKQTADNVDELGNVVERSYYGAGDIVEHEATYALDCDGSIDDCTLGDDGVASISISTSNGDWPTVTVKWYTGLPSCQSGSTYAVTVPSVEGKRKAQGLGFSVSSGGHISSATWTASAELSLLLDEDGDPDAYAFSGGTIEASAEAVGGTLSAASGLTITTSSTSESNTDYGSSSASATGILTGTEVSGSSSASE